MGEYRYLKNAMRCISLLLICASLITHICSRFGDGEKTENPTNSASETLPRSASRVSSKILNRIIKPTPSAPSENIFSEKGEKSDSDTVHLLIHNDFKTFLKSMPVMTLRKLKNLTLADPQAGHRYLLQLAKQVHVNTRDKETNHDKTKDCSKQNPKCLEGAASQTITMETSQVSEGTSPIGSASANPSFSNLGLDFDNHPDSVLLTLEPGRNKMRQFQFQMKNKDKSRNTFFSASSVSPGPFQVSSYYNNNVKQELSNGFPFMQSGNGDRAVAEADIITFGNSNFQDPIPEDYPQQFRFNSYDHYPKPEGSMGPYSWSIEPASLDKVQSETFLPPTAIFEAIAQAEREEMKHQERPDNWKHGPLRFHKDFNPFPAAQESSDVSQLYSKLGYQSNLNSPNPNRSPTQSRPAKFQKYYDSYEIKPSSNTLPVFNAPGPNYAQAIAPPGGSHFIPDPATFFANAGSGGPDYSSGYLPGPGPGNFANAGEYGGSSDNYYGQMNKLVDAAKTYLGAISKVTGAYNNEALTRKILEISIGILGFLAFGGYIAVLLFRPFIPEYLKFPYFPGTVNSTSTTYNGGLLGIFFGRSSDEHDRLLVLEQSFVKQLEEIVKVAVAEGHRKFFSDQ